MDMAHPNSDAKERLSLFNRLVDSYRKSRDDSILLDIQRQAQILNVMITEPIFCIKCPLTVEFFFSIKYLLNYGQSSPVLAWKLIIFLTNITDQPDVVKIIKEVIELGPPLISYLDHKTTEEKSVSLLNLLSRILNPSDVEFGFYIEPLVRYLMTEILSTESHKFKLQFLVNLCSKNEAAILHIRKLGYKKLFQTMLSKSDQSVDYKILVNMLLMQIDFDSMWNPENFLGHLFQLFLSGDDSSSMKVALEAFLHLCDTHLSSFLNKYDKYNEFFDLVFDRLAKSDAIATELKLILQLFHLLLKHVDKEKLKDKLLQILELCIRTCVNEDLSDIACKVFYQIKNIFIGEEFCEKITENKLIDFDLYFTKCCDDWLNAENSVRRDVHTASISRMKLLLFPRVICDGDIPLITRMLRCILCSRSPDSATTQKLTVVLLLLLHAKSIHSKNQNVLQDFLVDYNCKCIISHYLKGDCSSEEQEVLYEMFASNNLGKLLFTMTTTKHQNPFQDSNYSGVGFKEEKLLTEVDGLLNKLNINSENVDVDTADLMSLYELKIAQLNRQIEFVNHQLIQYSSTLQCYKDELKLSEYQRQEMVVSARKIIQQSKDVSTQKFSEMQTRISEMEKSNNYLTETLDLTKKKLVESENTVQQLEGNLKESHQFLEDLKLEKQKLQNIIANKDKQLFDLNKRKDDLESDICKLNKSLKELKLITQSQEESLNEKEKEIQKLSSELIESNKIREMIYEISVGKPPRK